MRISIDEFHSLLGSCAMGRPTRLLESTTSTNAVLSQWAADGAPHGAAVIAEEQTAGRGRRGRSWNSPAGLNIYTSVLLRSDLNPERQALLVYMMGLAVARSLNEIAGIETFLKWPNDVYAGGRKLCGILCESLPDDSHRAVIAGVGLNVNAGREDFPADLADRATSLRLLTGKHYSISMVLARLYQSIENAYKVFIMDTGRILAAWKERAGVPGTQYRIRSGGSEIRGVARDLDQDGALVIDAGGGVSHRVFSGDVIAFWPGGDFAFRH